MAPLTAADIQSISYINEDIFTLCLTALLDPSLNLYTARNLFTGGSMLTIDAKMMIISKHPLVQSPKAPKREGGGLQASSTSELRLDTTAADFNRPKKSSAG